jgi:MtfA peptidase
MCRKHPIPQALWEQTLHRYPFLRWRSDEHLAQLRRLTSLFLADKEFTGAGGFAVTDAVAVTIAAQAVLPVLTLGLGLYGGVVGIVVHGDAVSAQREVVDDDGVVHQFTEELSGEAMEGGPVMLSWEDVIASDTDTPWAYNVTIHEFAHVIDLADGVADGTPPLPTAASRRAWSVLISQAYADFCKLAVAGAPTRLDAYAAESIDEFFAVAVEAFFVDPDGLLQTNSALYAMFVGYFGQDPRAHRLRLGDAAFSAQ